MFSWLNNRCTFCSSSVNPWHLSITFFTQSEAFVTLESLLKKAVLYYLKSKRRGSLINKTFNHLCTYRHALRKISISLSMERCDGWKDGRELPMHSWIIRMAPSGHVVPLIASPGIHTQTKRAYDYRWTSIASKVKSAILLNHFHIKMIFFREN